MQIFCKWVIIQSEINFNFFVLKWKLLVPFDPEIEYQGAKGLIFSPAEVKTALPIECLIIFF